MKRFLMYLIVVIVVAFLGFMTYYALQNKEAIALIKIKTGDYICLNEGEVYDLPILHTKPYSKTTIDVESSNATAVSYNEESKKFSALSGGFSTITITPSNKNFGPFTFDIYVGDGSIDNPYFISTATQLASIAEGSNDDCYRLIKDIDLRTYNAGVWEPIGLSNSMTYKGVIFGDDHVIKHLKVTGTATNAGLFSVLGGGSKIENLILENVTLNGSFDNAGAFAGVSSGFIGKSRVKDLDITNIKSLSNNGGLVGSMIYNEVKATLNMCESDNVVIKTLDSANAKVVANIGGLVGNNEAGLILNCYADVNKFVGSGNIGGVAGVCSDEIVASLSNAKRKAIVKNTLAIVNNYEVDESAIVGGIVGANVYTTSDENVFAGNYYNSSTLTGLGNTEDVVANFKSLSSEQLKVVENYNNWNFDTVWNYTTGAQSALLKFDGSYQASGIYEDLMPISTVAVLNDAIEIMRSKKGGTYQISSDITYDITDVEVWEPIGGDDGFAGSLIVKEGCKLTIKGLNLVGDGEKYQGFFGKLSDPNCSIEGKIVFEDVKMSGNAEFFGSLAGQNLSTIKNVDVDKIFATIASESKVVCIGALVGSNENIIENCTINESETGEIKHTKNAELRQGGLVGENVNSAYINNCKVNTLKLSYEKDILNDDTTPKYIGGIAGANINSKIFGSESLSGEIVVTVATEINAAGISASNKDGAVISGCYSDYSISLSLTNNKGMAAGIAAINNTHAEITQSGFAGLIESNMAAGVVGRNHSSVTECYAGQGKIKAVYAGGIAFEVIGEGENDSVVNGTLYNCYTTQTLESANENSIVAGVTYKVKPGGIVKYCFGAAKFTGLGTAYAESYSEFRAVLQESFFDWFRKTSYSFLESVNLKESVGSFTNTIVTNYGSALIQYKNGPGKITGETFMSVSNEQFTSGEYKTVFTNAGFDVNIWQLDAEIVENATAETYYPKLKKAYYHTTEQQGQEEGIEE